MQPSQFLHADYLDIVFDNRNKNYGGYELRKHYTERAYKALGTTLFAISALVAVVLLTSGSAEVLLQPIQKTNVLAHLDNTVVIPPPAIKPPAIPKPAPANTTGPIHITVDNKVLPDDPKPDVTAAPNTTGAAGGGGTTTTGNTTGTSTTATLPATPKAAAPVKYVDEMPVLENLTGYLNKNIHYPDAARENGIQGRVIVQFVVNEDGGISEAQVVRGIGGGCDEEALRVVRNMPKWKPGRQHGSAVKVQFLLPVSFILQ